MSAEEKVFTIPGLRLIILEYYLDKTIKKVEEKPNCFSSIIIASFGIVKLLSLSSKLLSNWESRSAKLKSFNSIFLFSCYMN